MVLCDATEQRAESREQRAESREQARTSLVVVRLLTVDGMEVTKSLLCIVVCLCEFIFLSWRRGTHR
jgi:hypothetical protein